MLGEDFVSSVKKYASKNSEDNDIHGFLHVERVFNLCIRLGKELNANLLVLKIATLLHDIGRKIKKETSNNTNHAELSAEIASKFLQSQDYTLSVEDFENILHCIRSHSFSNNSNPKTLEAKILSDADKLDALGAIGLYRTIGFTIQNRGGIDQLLYHLENKIMKLKDLLYLDLSKKIAEERNQIIIDFYKELKNEIL